MNVVLYLKIIMISKKEIRLKLIKWLRLRENKFDSKNRMIGFADEKREH